MAYSYGGDPSANTLDAVRFLVGDTDPTDPLLQDGEINYFLSLYNNVPLNAAIRCCETIMGKFARMVNESVGGVKIDFSDRIKNMQTMRNMLVQRLATEDQNPYCGGISKADVQQVCQNSDRIPTDFTKQMMDNWQVGAWVSNGWGYGGWWGGWGSCGC